MADSLVTTGKPADGFIPPTTFPFYQLLPELQNHVLSFTCVVNRFQRVGDQEGDPYVPQGIWIRNGKLKNPWAGMMFVSRDFSRRAKELLFGSNNRFILSGDPALNRIWLWLQSARHLQKVRKLDLLIEWDDLESFYSSVLSSEKEATHSSTRPGTDWNGAWKYFIWSIPEFFDIPKLHLSLDLAFNNIILRGGLFPQQVEHPAIFIRQWSAIMSPLQWTKPKGQFSKLASFHLFKARYSKHEALDEQSVMGEEYDSIAGGKIPYVDRDPRLPHGTVDLDIDYWTKPKEEQDAIYKKITTMWNMANDNSCAMVQVWEDDEQQM